MTRIRWPALLVLLFPSVAEAQFLLPFGGGFDIGFSKVRRHGGIAFSLSRGYGGYYGPLYGNPYGRIVLTEVRVLTPPPIFVQVPPPVEVLAPQTVQLPSYDEVMARAPEPPLPGREAGRFRPLEPDNRERAQQPLKPDQPPDRPPPNQPLPKDPPQPGPRLPRPPLPDPDPRIESARQVALGKEAFRNGEYGRAAERFRHAADLALN